jgi:peptidoglycan/xylan/chitin deacetylase (PgdA/CDA1 family)
VVVPVNPVAGLHAVTWDQVREMKASGIEIGAHSRTHPSLGKIGNNLLKYEIQGSVEDVTRETGCTPVVFCYPNGQPADYNDLAKRYVREAGCHAAVTAFYDRNITNDLFELRRFNVGANWFQFSKVVNGLEVLSARWLDSNNRNYQFA